MSAAKTRVLQSLFAAQYKFGPRALLLTGTFSIVFSFLAFYTGVCQLLDPKPIGVAVLRSDVERAQYLIENPDTVATCVREFPLDICHTQYLYASFFILCGVYLIYVGFTQMFSSAKAIQSGKSSFLRRSMVISFAGRVGSISSFWSNKRRRVERVRKKSRLELTAQRAAPGVYNAVLHVVEKAEKTTAYQMHARQRFGGDWFWYKILGIVLFDVAMQIIRCFVVTESYATTSAPHTLAQVIVISLHLIFACLSYYHNSEIGSMVVSWASDLAYLMVRFSQGGLLAMKAYDFLDFCTTAVPFIFAVKEIDGLTGFILRAKESDQSRKHGFRQKALAVVCMLLAGCTGGFTSYKTYQKWQVFQAGDYWWGVDPYFPQNSGIGCFSWRFNWFLDPAASCAYVSIGADPSQYYGCGLFQEVPDEDSRLPQETFEHIQSARILEVRRHTECPMTDESVDYIMQFTNTRFLILRGLDSATFPDGFTKFSKLITLELEHSNLQTLPLKVVNSWPNLEHFGCGPCPFFQSTDVLAEADLPRLSSVQLFGAETCPSEDSEFAQTLDNFKCATNNANDVCPNLPQWFLEYYLDFVRGATNKNCFGTCAYHTGTFLTHGYDGLMPFNHFGFILGMKAGPLAEHYERIDFESWKCFAENIRSAVPFSQDFLKNFTGSTISDGLTISEYIALETGYGDCAQCEWNQWAVAHAIEIWANRSKTSDDDFEFEMPSECTGNYPTSKPT